MTRARFGFALSIAASFRSTRLNQRALVDCLGDRDPRVLPPLPVSAVPIVTPLTSRLALGARVEPAVFGSLGRYYRVLLVFVLRTWSIVRGATWAECCKGPTFPWARASISSWVSTLPSSADDRRTEIQTSRIPYCPSTTTRLGGSACWSRAHVCTTSSDSIPTAKPPPLELDDLPAPLHRCA